VHPWHLLLHCLLSTLQELRGQPAAKVWLQLLLNITGADAGAAGAGISASQLCKELLGCWSQTGRKKYKWQRAWLLSASSISGHPCCVQQHLTSICCTAQDRSARPGLSEAFIPERLYASSQSKFVYSVGMRRGAKA
jgi:hypothetical protein